jgi:hypothetical protein
MPIATTQGIAEEDKLLVQQHVGSALCSLYYDTVNQPLPDNIVMLLKILEATEQRCSECDQDRVSQSPCC